MLLLNQSGTTLGLKEKHYDFHHHYQVVGVNEGEVDLVSICQVRNISFWTKEMDEKEI